MTLDTTIFFEIALSGFLTVWVFRSLNGKKDKYSEFEWLGLSTFWGLLIIMLFTTIFKAYPHLQDILNNPFATAIITSIIGIGLGFIGNEINKWKWVHKMIDALKNK